MKILLSGQPGVGKSTILNKVFRLLLAHNLQVEGCIVNEIRNDGIRQGFKINYIPGPRETLLASTLETLSKYSLSKYSINIEGLESELLPFMKEMALSQKADVLVYDEIGRMQNIAPGFLAAVAGLLETHKPLLATIVQDNEEWAQPFKENAKVFYIEATLENRAFIPDLILAMLLNTKDFQLLTHEHENGVRCFFRTFLKENKFPELTKLFKHTLPYLALGRATFDPNSDQYVVQGKSATRHVTIDDKSVYHCTCQFHQGEFREAQRRICSHIQTVAILKGQMRPLV